MAIDPNKFGGVLVEPAIDPSRFGGVLVEDKTIPDAVIGENIDKIYTEANDIQINAIDFIQDLQAIPFTVEDPQDVSKVRAEGAPEVDPDVEDTRVRLAEAMGQVNPMFLLPFVGAGFKAVRMFSDYSAAVRFVQNPEPPRASATLHGNALMDAWMKWTGDKARTERLISDIARAQRGMTVPARIATGALELPGFMIEFLLTAGTYSTLKAGTQKAITKILERQGVRIGNKLITRTGGAIVGSAGRVPFFAGRVAEGQVQKQRPVELTPKGELVMREAIENPFLSLAKSVGDVYIESLSEVSGKPIGEAAAFLAKKTPLLGKWFRVIAKEFKRKKGGDFFTEITTKAEYNGFLQELAEERVGGLMRAATGVQDFGEPGGGMIQNMIDSIPGFEDFMVEAGVLIIPAGGRVASRVVSARKKGASDQVGVKEIADQPVDAIAEFAETASELDFTEARAEIVERYQSLAHAMDLIPALKIRSMREMFDNAPEGLKMFSVEEMRYWATALAEAEIAVGKLPAADKAQLLSFPRVSRWLSIAAEPVTSIETKTAIGGEVPQTELSKKETPIIIQEIPPGDKETVALNLAEIEKLPKAKKERANEEALNLVKERIAFKPKKKSVGTFFSDLVLSADVQFREEFARLRQVVKATGEDLPPESDPMALAVAFRQKSSAKTRAAVMEGTHNLAGTQTGKSLREVMLPVAGDKKKEEDFFTYLVALRSQTTPDIESGLNPVAAKLVVDSMGTQEFQRMAREFTQWNQSGIDLLVESGALSAEAGQAIKDANPIYVPFFREFTQDEGTLSPPRGSGAAKAADVIKKRKGSQRRILNPLQESILQMERMIATAQRAKVAGSMAQLVENFPNELSEFITAVPTPIRPVQFTAEEVQKQLEEVGVDFEGLNQEATETMLKIFRPIKGDRPGQGLFTLKVGGKDKFFKIEKNLADVLMGMDSYKLPVFWDIILGKPTRALKLGATGLNPDFALRNLLRDVSTFSVTSKHTKVSPLSALAGTGKTVASKAAGVAERFGFRGMPQSEDLKLFSALGGEMSGFIGADRKGVKHLVHDMLATNGRRYTINTFRHPVDALRSVIGVTEIGPRLGEFSAARIKGEELYGKDSLSANIYALNAAQDVTINFTRHGKTGKMLNEMIAFFNVAIQAPDKILRTFKENPQRATASAIAYLTVPAVMLWYKNRDEPWYKNMTPHERFNYLHLQDPNDEDKILRIPVPYELGHAFQALPVAILDQMYNDSPGEVGKLAGEAARMGNPLDVPAFISPFIDIGKGPGGKDFAGRPIVPRSAEGKLPEDQYGPHTTELMKFIGSHLKLSPAKIEHLVNSYSGGLYNRVARMIKTNDMERTNSDLPVIGSLFTRDPFAPRRQVELFYNHRSELSQKNKSKKISAREYIELNIKNNLATILSAQFDVLREAKTTSHRKQLWTGISKTLTLADRINPKDIQ